MAKTFQEIRDDAYRDIVISTKFHGEVLVLIPDLGIQEDGAAWQAAIANAIAAGAANQMTASVSGIVEEDGSFDDDQSLRRVEHIAVQCCRDPTSVDRSGNALGGLAAPDLHLGILRSATLDPLQIPFMFQREMDGSTDLLWRLHFKRVIEGVRGLQL